MKKTIIFFILFFMLIRFSSACDLASKDFQCTCSGSYPCSSFDCSPSECTGSLCGAKDFYEFTGSCIAYGLSGYCQVSDCSDCEYSCNDNSGCFGNCCGSGDCASDYDFCKTSTQIYTRDYYCSSYYCSYTDNFDTNCGFSGAYSEPYCSSSSTSTKVRDVGICDTFLGVPFCSTEEDFDNTYCDSGCASGIFETEYQYKCAGTFSDYMTQKRDIYGYCRLDNDVTFSDYGSGLVCGSNSWCSSSLDENVKTYQYELTSPCEQFAPTVTANVIPYIVLQNQSLAFKGASTQTYLPNRVCFDEYNDGSIEACYGLGYTGNWNDYYNVNTSIIGTRYIKIYQYNTIYGLIDSEVISYRISSAYTDAEIQISYGANVNFESNKSVNVGLSSESSVTSGTFLAKCWSSTDADDECYGTVGNCNTYCPSFTRVSDVLNTIYVVNSATGKTGKVNLFVYSDIGSDIDSINVCFNDNETRFYCGTCFDSIKNQDETSVDFGGVCGSCFDNIQNVESGETYIDYGGKCGTCYDGLKQNFESDIDYGGICGNCSGIKSDDYKWEIGRQATNEIPFDNSYCFEKSDAIISSTILLLMGIIAGAIVILIIILIFLIIPNVGYILGFVIFTKNLIDKFKNRK